MNCAFIMTNISNVDSDASEPLTDGKSNRVAQQLIAEERTKIINIATEEATAIKTRAEQEAEILREYEKLQNK